MPVSTQQFSPSTGPLPAELYHQLLPLLDPVTYVAFGQTCRLFRNIAVIEHHHLVLRLLCLELDYEHGGPTPLFTLGGNLIMPFFDDPSWNDLRYACTSCLRLRHVRHFEIVSVFRLAYRKPNLSEAASHQQSEQGTAQQRWHSRQLAAGHDAEPGIDPLDRWRCHSTLRRYVCQQLFPGRSHLPSYLRPDGISQAEEPLIRRQVAGAQRHRRKCIDCWNKVQSGNHRRFGRLNNASRRSRRTDVSYDPNYDSIMIQGRPDFRIHYPGMGQAPVLTSSAYLAFKCVCCAEWEPDHQAFEQRKDLLTLLFKWDFEMPHPSWRSSRQWICDTCELARDITASSISS